MTDRGSNPAPRHASRSQRTVLTLVSVGTAAWLLVDVTAKATIHATTWPFSALTMFSEPRDEAVVVTVEGQTAAGSKRIDAEDLGFAAGNQLHVYLRRKVVEVSGSSVTPRADGADALQSLARVYRRHEPTLDQLSVYAVVTQLPLGGKTRERRWSVLTVQP